MNNSDGPAGTWCDYCDKYHYLPGPECVLYEPKPDDFIEYGQLMSDGGFHTFVNQPDIEAIYPLADRIKAGMRNGGHVYRRRIVVLEDWQEVTE